MRLADINVGLFTFVEYEDHERGFVVVTDLLAEPWPEHLVFHKRTGILAGKTNATCFGGICRMIMNDFNRYNYGKT